MDGFGSGQRFDRRQRDVVVSGKGYGASQTQYSADPTRASRGGESKRKKRIYKYKVYTVEGKVKASLRNGLRWIKNKCSEMVRGY